MWDSISNLNYYIILWYYAIIWSFKVFLDLKLILTSPRMQELHLELT